MPESTIIVAIIAGLSASFLKPIVDAIIAFFKRKNERKEKSADNKDSFEARIAALEKREAEEVEDLIFCKNATHLLLKDRVINLTRESVDKGEITLAVKAFIVQSVDLLHADGENGTMTACVDAIENLKVV